MRKIVLGLCLVAMAAPALAGDDSLVDLLRQKGVLTTDEAQRLGGTEMAPATRDSLIEVLRSKGVLSPDEAARLAPAAPAAPAVMPATAPTPQKPVELAAAPPSSPSPLPMLSYEDGFLFRTQDDKFSFRLNGRVNELFVFQQPGTTQSSTMAIDRARLSVDATFYKVFRSRLEYDFAAASSGLRDAYVAWVPMPEFNVQLGQFKVPFSYEALMSSRYIPFVDRSAVVRGTVPGQRDIGAMAYGHLFEGVALYQVALLNGTGQNVRDNNSAKDVAARLFLTPLRNGDIDVLKELSVGGAFTYGLEAKDAAGQPNTIEGVSDTNFVFYPRIARGGYRQRYNAQLAWLHGPATVTAEVIFTNEQRKGVGPGNANLAPLKTNGAYVGGTYMLTGETKPFNKRVRPARPFLWPIGDAGPGAWEVAARWEYFDLQHTPDSPEDVFPRNRYDAFLAGLNWYPNEFTRLSVNYIYGYFEETDNGLSPVPDGHSDNAVTGRAQIEF